MRFSLIDRITEIDRGKKISAIKNLSMAEEYLADHFPGFAVMPGVLMLEAMTQTAAWLIRDAEDFARTMIVLKEARNVKYAKFVEPGQTLTVTAELLKQSGDEARFKAEGLLDGRTAVSGRLSLRCYNLADEDPRHAKTDVTVRDNLREWFELLYRPVDASGSEK